jgi:glucose dehydrogenase
VAKTVAIIGSGIVGTTVAYLLTGLGHRVNIYEKGPEYPYPHNEQFAHEILYLRKYGRIFGLPKDLKKVVVSGDYKWDLNQEIIMHVGGAASRWSALTLRMSPNDFRTRSLYGFGDDWPITYDDLEPYYCKAESYLGVSGFADNPFAPWRSKPYPMPGFEMSYENQLLAERLRKKNITLHTTPQARNRIMYQDRSACANFGTCMVCPIGARYSPAFHLQLATKTGLCKLYTNASVRSITIQQGRVRSIICNLHHEKKEEEHDADLVVLAAGAIESARLLLLSRDSKHPDGIGNKNGLVGKNLMFHHIWGGTLHYKDKLFPGRMGPNTGECHQFIDPPGRGKHGGIKLAMWGDFTGDISDRKIWEDGEEVVEALRPMLNYHSLKMHAETIPSVEKNVSLSKMKDRFGDPYAEVHYKSTDFDRESYVYSKSLFDKFISATEAVDGKFAGVDEYSSGHHHMGTCRMGRTLRDSVVDQFGKVHEVSNLFVLGGANFVSSSAVNPTLTMVALAMRSVDYLADLLL